MKDRIRQLMESQNMTQQKFADVTKISAASLSSIFNDRTKPTLNHVDAIRKSFPNINLAWLLYGDGEMFATPEEKQEEGKAVNATPSGDLFFDFAGDATPSVAAADLRQPVKAGHPSGAKLEKIVVKNIDRPQRQISEIRIFFDDQTWETFVPKK